MPGTLCWTTAPPIDTGTMCLAPTSAPGTVRTLQPASTPSGTAEPLDGLELVLTPVQLAAIFNNETIETSGSLSERFWGAATAVGGALELVGAAALLLTPEPTLTTKVAGTALGLHGADTASTGIRQMWSGRTETSMTSEAVSSAAQAFGVSEEDARRIGLTVDVAIPLLAGFVGAARALAIRRGSISLVAEEAAGGHTIARHVGRTEAQLRARLLAEPRIKAASTFHSLRQAETFIGEALRANRAEITAWLKTAAVGTQKAFPYSAGRVVGSGVVRATNTLQPMTRMTVVIRRIELEKRVYFVLTSYPIP